MICCTLLRILSKTLLPELTDMHYFKNDIHQIPLPNRFTNPFNYTPHPLCIMAAAEVQDYIQERNEWHQELQQGKMFGVLVVCTPQGEIGYLAAFSGNLANSNHHDFFVPPVYDLLNPDGYFKEEERNISCLTEQIAEMNHSEPFLMNIELYKQTVRQSESELKAQKESMKKAKEKRDMLRQTHHLSPEELKALERESQFMKAELKRKERKWEIHLNTLHHTLQTYKEQIKELEDERRLRSVNLQKWLFQQFVILNAKGKKKNLLDIFHTSTLPPAGAGECAAPKLLQHAYLHHLKPIAMAEFWWGDSPKGEIRHHGYYYPACKHKCEPILNFMLEGLKVEADPRLSSSSSKLLTLEIVYEDEYLLVMNKPAGMLSVPGKTDAVSVLSILQKRYPQATGPLLVHRLDMDTSGLLLAAKTKKVHAALQEQFEKQQVKKRYIALLSGKPKVPPTGFIRLPLLPDYLNRPQQKVDHEHGKPSVTRYELLEDAPFTRIAFYPETGRTHQLRVHAAHQHGLDCPILGDPLYGQPAERLYLHAERLEFRHPVTGKMQRIVAPCPF